MQRHIWKQNSETTLDNFRKKYCMVLDPQIHDGNSKWTLRSPHASYHMQGKLLSPFQALPRPQRSGARLFYNLCSHQAPSQLSNQSSPILAPLLLLSLRAGTPDMFQARSLCLGILICWNVPFLQIHVTQSLYCPESFLRVNFHDCHCCYKNRKH